MFVWSLTLCTRNVDIIFFIKANKLSSSTIHKYIYTKSQKWMIHGASQKLYLHQVNILFNAKNQIVYTNQQNLIYQKLFFLPCLAQVFFFNDFFVIDRLNKELIYDFFFLPREHLFALCVNCIVSITITLCICQYVVYYLILNTLLVFFIDFHYFPRTYYYLGYVM